MSKVLVVDDSESHRLILKSKLQERGFEVFDASEGLQALTLASNENPQLILIDLNMPTLDGWSSIRLMRERVELAKTPIVAMSASFLEGDKERAVDAGCNFCAHKPVDLDQLLASIFHEEDLSEFPIPVHQAGCP